MTIELPELELNEFVFTSITRAQTLEEIKFKAIELRLRSFNYNRTKTAKSLDISIRSLRNIIVIMRKKGYRVE